MTERVHLRWPADAPVWELEAALLDAPANAGLMLRDVFFRGHRVLCKASLPVVLTRSPPENPGRFDLHLGVAWPQKSGFGTPHVFVDRTLFGDEIVLEISAGFECAPGLRAFQRYYLHGDGRLSARFWVGGNGTPPPSFLQVVGFYRFDFDIDGAPADRVARFDLVEGEWNETILPTEIAVNRRKGTRVFRQIDTKAKKGFWILPGPRDGASDGIIGEIAKHDLWFLRYHGNEDRDGIEGGDDDKWLDAQLGGELMMSNDVVTWYTVRVPSPAHGWIDHGWSPPTGPDLAPFDWWPPTFAPEAGDGPGDGDPVTDVPPLPILQGRIKHWRSTPWLLHERGTDTFDLDLPAGSSFASVELDDYGLWGTFKITQQPNEGDVGRVRLVIEWERPLWGHVEYVYLFRAHDGFVTNVADTVSTDAEKDVRPFSERLGPIGDGGADLTTDWHVKKWGDDF